MAGVPRRFFVLAPLVFFGLLGAWRWTAPVYRPFFHGLGGAVFGRLGDQRLITFREFFQEEHYDTQVRLGHPDAPDVEVPMRVSSYHCGYKPTALLLALLVATPMGLRRRAVTLASGLVAAQAFVLLRLALVIGVRYSGFRVSADGETPIDLRWMPSDMLDTLNLLLWDDLSSTYVVPIVIWILLVVRWRDAAAPEEQEALPAAVPGGEEEPA